MSSIFKVLKSLLHCSTGNEQTAVDLLDIEDQDLMREEILNLLGLTRVPKKNSNFKFKGIKNNKNQTVC